MLYPIHVLDDAEARIAGMPLSRALAALDPGRVEIDLGAGSLSDAMWTLPVVDAVARAYPRAEVSVAGHAPVARLISAHLRSAAARPRKGDTGRGDRGGRALVVRFAPTERAPSAAYLEDARGEAVLTVPHAPFPRRAQHVSAHWIDGGQVAGLDAHTGAPRLRLPRAAAREARRLCRALVGAGSGPMVVLAAAHGEGDQGWGAAAFARIVERLRDRIGAAFVVLGGAEVPGAATRVPDAPPEVIAGLLGLAAVCIADADGRADETAWAHVAAAVGAPVVTLHGESCPTAFGPASRHGAAVFTTRGTCVACEADPGRRCLPCLSPERVAEVAEELSAARWPWDRLLRMAP